MKPRRVYVTSDVYPEQPGTLVKKLVADGAGDPPQDGDAVVLRVDRVLASRLAAHPSQMAKQSRQSSGLAV